MKNGNISLGKWGEDQATAFLIKLGYRIIDRNYQKKYGEIDIIVEKNKKIHFIEVKTRNSKSINKYGLPEEAVNDIKQKKLIKTAYYYLGDKKIKSDIDWQIDVVSIICNKDNLTKRTIRYIPDAFNEN